MFWQLLTSYRAWKTVVWSWKHQKDSCFSFKIVIQNVSLMLSGNYLDGLTRIVIVFFFGSENSNSPETFDVSSSLPDYSLLE